MKIAILAPPWIAIPPVGYGGTERVIANLTEGLVKKGHDVTLFATGDSQTSARLHFYYPKALGNDMLMKQESYSILFHLHAFMKLVGQEHFDIIHNHLAYSGMFFLDLQNTPFVHTLHGPYYKELSTPIKSIEDKRLILENFKLHPFISISDNQRLGFPELNYVQTIYNGIIPIEFGLGNGKGDYLVWLGRINRNKGLDTAIHAAKKAGMKLKISGYIEKSDQEYFDTVIQPLIDGNTEFVGEVKDIKAKNEFLGNAFATLFPIRWHEPFGLVMIESLASGTPVIAFNKGSAPEVIEDGKTGFIVENEDEMASIVSKVSSLDRVYCHEYAISKFSVDRMVEEYENAYLRVIENKKK